MSKSTKSTGRGCLNVIGLLVFGLAMMVAFTAGLAVLLMFAWGYVAPVFDAPLLDFPAAFALTGIVLTLAAILRR